MATKTQRHEVKLFAKINLSVLVSWWRKCFTWMSKLLRTPHSRRSLDLISNHAKRLEAFDLGIEDNHSTLEVAVDAFKPG